MFDQIIDAMTKGTTSNVFGYSQQMMECTLRLAKSQSDVMKGLYDELGQEFRTLATSSDPSLMAKNWPELMSSVIQANTQASALLMKNAQEFQSEMLQLARIPGFGLPEQIMKNMMGLVKTPTAPIERSAEQTSSRAKRAA